jgi:hypothetical protein
MLQVPNLNFKMLVNNNITGPYKTANKVFMHVLQRMAQLEHDIELGRQADSFFVPHQKLFQTHRVEPFCDSRFWLILVNVVSGDVGVCEFEAG